jgi:hypothetical protein
VESWLAGAVSHAEALREGRPEGPEAGATAAAILLRRRHQSIEAFGLEPAADTLLKESGFADNYRFARPEGRERVLQWWKQGGTRP